MQDNSKIFQAHALAIADDALLLRASNDYLDYASFQLAAIRYAGPRALELGALQAAGAPPDVIVCDYLLSGTQSSIDIIQSIRALFEREIPAILFAGDIILKTAEKAAATPASLILLKPMRMKMLAKEIEALLPN